MNAHQPLAANDLTLLRIEQARMLKERVAGSCRIVGFIVFYTSVMIGFVHSFWSGVIWLGLGSAMVLVTYIYAKLAIAGDITSGNVSRFLRGHCAVSAATGAAWSGYSIYLVDYTSYFTLFAGATLVCSITLGGVVPRSAYRPTYVALASTAVLPFGAYIALSAPGAMALLGVGLMAYFLFLMFVSARVEMDIRDTIAAQNARQLNELILARNDVYREANTDKMRFIAGLSHDLAQPLHAQGFLIEGLKARLPGEEARALLERIEDCWRSQLGMLRDLSELSKLEYGEARLNIGEVALAKECRTIARLQADKYPDGPSLSLELEEAAVNTDPNGLSRILQNLISNAFKHSPASGQVSVRSARQGTGALIKIEDTGPGIAQGEIDRIFAEFVQLGEGRADSEGSEFSALANTGLGLSIVDRLCKRLSIKVEINSREGVGTCVTLSVPSLELAGKEDKIAPTPQLRSSANPLIIVIEDDPGVLEATRIALEARGCRVIAGSSAEPVLENLAEIDETPDLLLVDLALGKESGLDAISALREECNADIPAVLMSANWSSNTTVSGLSNIIRLSKPIDPQAIWLVMEDQLYLSEE